MTARLLFDENLSVRLVERLKDVFPDSAHVMELGLAQSLDSDFADMAAVLGAPPKVLWLRCGNKATSIVEELLRRHAESVRSFAEDPEALCLELYA